MSKSERKNSKHAGTDRESSGGVRVDSLAAMMLLATFTGASAASSSDVEFPFEHRGGLLWVRVSVPSVDEPLNFLLDSGAGVSMVNLRTAKRLGVKLGQRVDVRGMGSSAEGFWPQRLNATAGGLALPKDFLAVDLAALSRACDCNVDGLIAADFFRGRVVQIDFVERKVRLLPASDAAGDAAVDLKNNRGALLAAVAVNDGKPQWMRLDMGCASQLQWVVRGANRPDAKRGVSVGLTELNISTTTTTVKLGAALNDLMERHGEKLFHYRIRCLQNDEDAADLAQETFVRVDQNPAKFRLDAENNQTGHSFRDSLPEHAPMPSDRLQADERTDAVRHAVAALPEDLRTPLLLAEYEEGSQAEIGAILGCTAKGVETRIYRARQQLRVPPASWSQRCDPLVALRGVSR